MAQSLKTRTIFQSATAFVGDVRCRPTDGGCSCEEVSHVDDFAFVRRGMFIKHVGKRKYTANPNHVVFFNRDEPYRVSHPIRGGDDCSAFSIRRDVLTSIIAEFDPSAADRRSSLFQSAESSCDAALHMRHLKLLGEIERGELTDVAVEEQVLILAREVMRQASGGVRRRRRAMRPETRRARADCAEEAKRIISADFRTPLSLDELSHRVHASPYHLCRIFRDVTGRSIHAYRTDLRLRCALDRLADGERNLTSMALELGFADHGHFSNAFRRNFCISPSQFRLIASRRAVREMSRNLQVS
jgi:AraC-like DNA-binding protein